MDAIDADIAWEECIPDLPLDTNNLPPLNALSTDSSHNLDLLDLLNFESDKTPDSIATPGRLPSVESLSTSTEPLTVTAESFSHSQETLSQCTEHSTMATSQTPPPRMVHLPSDQSTVGSRISSPSHTASEEIPSPQQSAPASPQPAKRRIPNKPKSRRPKRATKRKETESNSKDSLVLELTTRLASASAETAALRKRVASLTQENRSLRAALDHANARLVAVAQAAAAVPPTTTSQPPVVVGLAQMSQEVAGRISGALTVNDMEEAPRKKRKRVTGAATTMACVMFMWGAFIGTPGLLKAASKVFGGEDSNLPAVWKGGSDPASSVPAVPISRLQESWPPNCMTVLKELPSKSTEDEPTDLGSNPVKQENIIIDEEDEKVSAEKMFVDMRDEDAAKVVALADTRDRSQPQYSYVLCRDAKAAISNIRACSESKKNGEACGPPHTISLILPASAAGMDDENSTDSLPALAEVQCNIMSIARIPVDSMNDGSSYGRVIATVPQSGTVIRG
eukprot:TRINITY_DN510_c0_g1_i1.p2 TRINITY_DN510_c0_g1~~TRINITY_DN510_c0_g1_i1.p2  ORF type:complete len:509 (+),score=92.11 TRINITY_DN510_c0_g1_i1:5862-7388(+)